MARGAFTKRSRMVVVFVTAAQQAATFAQSRPPEPGFSLTGLAPGTTFGQVNCLTQDGSVAGGVSASASPIFQIGFTWSKSGGRSDFGLLPGMPKVTNARGISDVGQIAGVMNDGNFDNSRAFRWNGNGPLQNLGVLPGETRSVANGISGDGNVVVGRAEHGPNSQFVGQAFRWTPSGGMEGLGYIKPGGSYSDARGVSRDGKTIVGISRSQSPTSEAFVWKEGIGMTGLPQLPGSNSLEAYAQSVSADGSVIVGSAAISVGGVDHATRWTASGAEDLMGSAYPGLNSIAYALNDDGSIIGGTLGGGVAFIWTQSTGFLQATDYLAMYDLAVPSGYFLVSVNAISGDGLTIAGEARNLATNIREGFIATVPAGGPRCYPDCDASGSLTIDDFICFQTLFAVGDPEADCDGDAQLTIDDFVCFQTSFAVGC